MTTGEKIREARKKAKLTQKKLGELCGIAEPTIRRYELGTLNPKKETLEKIAIPLGCYYFELYGDKDAEDVKTIMKEGMRLGAQAKSAIDRMTILAEYKEKGYQFTADEESLVSSYNRLNFTSQIRVLSTVKTMAEDPQYSDRPLAAERMDELTEIPKYQRQPPPSDSPTDPSEDE